MTGPHQYFTILGTIQSKRRTTVETLQLACLYAGQALLCAGLLLAGYHLTKAPGVLWALVSAVLVLQPAIEQSVAASAIRIAANVVGSVVGFAVGATLGTGPGALLLALTVTIFISEFLRLDLGLRTACVATLIVMITNEGRVVTSSFERASAVLIGCLLAVGVQIFAQIVRRLCGWRNSPPALVSSASRSHDE